MSFPASDTAVIYPGYLVLDGNSGYPWYLVLDGNSGYPGYLVLDGNSEVGAIYPGGTLY